MKKILFLLLCAATSYAQIVPTGQETAFDYGIQNTASQLDDNATYITVQTTDGVQGKSASSVWAKKIYVDNVDVKKAFLSTGLIKNGLVTTNADPTKFNITAGIGIISNFDNPENPTSTIVSFPAFTGITPTYLTSGNITYVAITLVDGVPVVLMQATPFDNVQRRNVIALGATIHSNLTTINLVNNISAPTNAGTNQLHDLMEAIGALNVSGNKYSANGANLSLNKSAGDIFKLGVNFANNWRDPNKLTIAAGTALTFRYRFSNSVEGTDVTVLDPSFYESGGVSVPVPVNRFSIQTVTLFQTGQTRIQPGQSTYATMAEAEAAIITRAYVVESNIAANGITRAYIILRHNATDLTNATTSKIIEAQKFGGVASGGVALTDSAIIAALGFTPENVANKATDYTTVNNTLYPTVQASETRIIGTTTVQNIIVVDGDSRPAGYTGSGAYPISDHLTLNIPNQVIYNTADGGATFGDFEFEGVQWKQKAAFTNVDPKLTRYGWNILLIWAGYNDMSVRDQNATITYQKLVGYANARKKAGWRVFVFTEPATTSIIGESRRLEYNLLVRANWSKFADGLVDLGSNEFLGLPGAASNTTYFADGVHMTPTGYQIAANVSSAVVNRYTDINVRIVNGETLIQGTPANGTIGTEQVLTLQRESLAGTSYSNSASFKLGRHTGIGGLFNPYTRLDFNLKSSLLNGYVSDVNVATMYDTGQTGFGYTSISDIIDYKVAINGKALVNNRMKSTAGIEWGNDVYQVGESRLYNDASNGTILTAKTGSSNDFLLTNGGGSGVFRIPTGTQDIIFSGSISAISPSFTGTPTAPTATVGTNTTQIATTAFVQTAMTSGTYTPSFTNTTNISASTLNAAYYTKIGNIITVTIAVQVTLTAAADTILTFSLPVSGATVVSGIGQANLTSGGGAINAYGIVDITNSTTAQLRMGSTAVIGSGSGIAAITFTYTL